jgi:hypothetical protein
MALFRPSLNTSLDDSETDASSTGGLSAHAPTVIAPKAIAPKTIAPKTIAPSCHRIVRPRSSSIRLKRTDTRQRYLLCVPQSWPWRRSFLAGIASSF